MDIKTPNPYHFIVVLVHFLGNAITTTLDHQRRPATDQEAARQRLDLRIVHPTAMVSRTGGDAPARPNKFTDVGVMGRLARIPRPH